MSQNESNLDPFYLTYKDQFPCWPLIAMALALNFVAISGMLLNFGVIWTTIKCSSLRQSANYLLAFYSLFELIHQHGHLLFLWTAFSTQHFISYQLATKICTVSLFAFGGIAPSMAFTGFDRLLCVLFPAFPKWANMKLYLTLIFSTCFGFSFYLLIIFYQTANEMPNLMITGTIGEFFQDEANTVYGHISLISNSITIIFYIIVGLLIRLKSAPTTNFEKNQRRIYRSLFAIILLNIGGYLIIVIYINVFTRQWFVQQGIAIITNLSAASNGPILYWTSKIYRKAFKREFSAFLVFLGIKKESIAAGGMSIGMIKINPIFQKNHNKITPQTQIE